VKQIVTEVLRDDGEGEAGGSKKRLFYQPLASVWLDEEKLRIERLHDEELLPPERESLARLAKYYAFEKERYDGEAVRSVMGRAFEMAEAIPVRNSGGMYFIPEKHGDYAENILTFVGEVRQNAEDSLRRKARPSTAFSVPLVDREEYRELLEDSLDEHVKKEAQALISEMARALKGDSGITKKRQQSFIERIKALKSNVRTYEELLQMEAQGARDNLEVAMKQARSLLEDQARPTDSPSGQSPQGKTPA
jgi:phage pi2 protein 07